MINRIMEYLVGFIFIISAVAKLSDFSNTVHFIMSVFGLGFVIVKSGLIMLSLIEIGIGISFILNIWKNKILFQSIVGLLMFFIFLNLFLMLKGYSNCGCFGTRYESNPIISLIKNLLIVGFMFISNRTNKKPSIAAQ